MITLENVPEYKIQYVKEHYPRETVKSITSTLHMSTATVTAIIKKLGLQKLRVAGRRVVWTDKMIAHITKNFKNTDNETLAFELGVSPRTMSRKAAELGLTKSKQFLHMVQREAGAASKYFLRKRGLKVWGGQKAINNLIEGGKPYRFGAPLDPRFKRRGRPRKQKPANA